MIDLQKLVIGMASQALGGGLRSSGRSSMRRSSRTRGSSLNQGKLLMGLLGMAVAAYEHYSQSSARASPPQSTGIPPALPARGTSAPPPPPPGRAAAEAPGIDQNSLLLLRAMVASAYADQTLDEGERSSIVKQLGGHELSAEERSFLDRELANPQSIETLASQAGSFEQSKQLYAAAAVAVRVDSDSERDFLTRFAKALQLDENSRREIDSQLGLI